MTLDWSRGPVHLLGGDVRARLRDLPDEGVHCVVTSPPYWGLRAYATEPQIWRGREDCEHAFGDTLRVLSLFGAWFGLLLGCLFSGDGLSPWAAGLMAISGTGAEGIWC